LRIDELDTPVPVVDLDIVEHNLAKMQAYCDSHGLSLRPHIKTHKIPAFAHRQVELGAKGITCQKLGEAEVMIDAGLDDILISYPLVGPAKADRLASLSRRARLRVAVDSSLAADTVAAAARASNTPIGVLVEFDSGNARTGVVSVDQALDLAIQIEKSGLRFDGLMTYPSTAATVEFVAEARERFSKAGIPIGVKDLNVVRGVAGLDQLKFLRLRIIKRRLTSTIPGFVVGKLVSRHIGAPGRRGLTNLGRQPDPAFAVHHRIVRIGRVIGWIRPQVFGSPP